ncbi:MAG: AAA family ATPase [Oscillatoriales cyanobacterium SM2_1_8]|nr:AAA family ATPase [Oscillatoriales cyanobacterium SM2_1_8]
MLHTLKIQNFRRFRDFELSSLGRINLLVGKNNTGKTSILEAVQLLYSVKDPAEPLSEIMLGRGEYSWGASGEGQCLDIRHLFSDHEIQVGSRFSILGVHENQEEKLVATLEADELEKLVFSMLWRYGKDCEEAKWIRELSEGVCLPIRLLRLSFRKTKSNKVSTKFLKSSSWSSAKMLELFNQVVLTAKEETVYEALQAIEPRLERIASVADLRETRWNSREGFAVRLVGSAERLPIGSLGDGFWRMLGLSLAAVGVAEGILLVDEIDTGLHFNTLSDMWRLLWETAKRLDIQIFATTHSSDCWQSLARLANQEDTQQYGGISIHRIERDRPTGIVFREAEMAIAAEHEIEVR